MKYTEPGLDGGDKKRAAGCHTILRYPTKPDHYSMNLLGHKREREKEARDGKDLLTNSDGFLHPTLKYKAGRDRRVEWY